jgi:hypothetical protein
MSKMTVEAWLAVHKEAALKIDPETAEVFCGRGFICDPYGFHPNLPEELRQSAKLYFASAPGTDIWVYFDDLPEKTKSALWKRLKSDRRLQAKLEEVFFDDFVEGEP